MEPWTRVNKELLSHGKSWVWLQQRLGIEKIQTVNHWKARGIPAKYHSAIEIALKKQPGWLMDLVSPYAPPADLTQGAKDLGALYDIIPESDTIRRMQALADASKAIMRVLQPSDASNLKAPE